MRQAQWLVDVGPDAGARGGRVLYSGEPDGLRDVAESRTARYLFDEIPAPRSRGREAAGWLELQGIHRHNLHGVDARIPLGLLTAVTGISGSGKSSLVAQALPELVLLHLGHEPEDDATEGDTGEGPAVIETTGGHLAGDVDAVRRLVQVDQKPIGRTPRSNLATTRVCSITCASCSPPPPSATPSRRRTVLVQRGQRALQKPRGRGFVSV